MINPQRRESKRPDTFKDFQKFSLEALEWAAKHCLGLSFEERFRYCSRVLGAANDNGIPLDVSGLLFSDELMNMLRVWLACDRDMLRAKLTYVNGMNYEDSTTQGQ